MVVERRVRRRVGDHDTHPKYASRLLVRTWNVFHGNASPRGGSRSLERAVRLSVVGRPEVVLLQELPPFALRRLEGWTGYRAFGAVASRPRLREPVAEWLTDLRPHLFRGGLEGQANAILVAPQLRARDHMQLVLNPRRVRDRESRRLALSLRARISWARERRVVHAVRVVLEDTRTVLVANLHATSYRADKRIADAELLRAATFADAIAAPHEPIVLGGDFNVTVVTSPTLRSLATPEWGFSPAGPGLDHVLVRGLEVVEPERAWPDVRRRYAGVLLSDHAPVEVVVR